MKDRLATLAHYVIYSREPSELGKTKLATILWLADVMMYRASGHSITGSTEAQKQKHGPVPVGFFEAVDRLKAQKKIVEREALTPAGNRIECVTEPDISAFTGEEIAAVDRLADIICQHAASAVSEALYDPLWQEVPLGGKIPIGAAATSLFLATSVPSGQTVTDIVLADADEQYVYGTVMVASQFVLELILTNSGRVRL
jgi:Protein of unknown function (DUF4065)